MIYRFSFRADFYLRRLNRRPRFMVYYLDLEVTTHSLITEFNLFGSMISDSGSGI